MPIGDRPELTIYNAELYFKKFILFFDTYPLNVAYSKGYYEEGEIHFYC